MNLQLPPIAKAVGQGVSVVLDEFDPLESPIEEVAEEYSKLSDRERGEYSKARKCAQLLKQRNPDLVDTVDRLTYELLKRSGKSRVRSYYLVLTNEGHAPFKLAA